MALYFFHSRTNLLLVDDEGTECATDAVAQREAVCTVAELIRDEPDAFWATRPWSMQVADTTGAILFEIEVTGTTHAMLTPGVPPEPSPADSE